MKLLEELEPVSGVIGFSRELDVRLAIEHRAHTEACERLVFDEE
jgi:hypothetical protein